MEDCAASQSAPVTGGQICLAQRLHTISPQTGLNVSITQAEWWRPRGSVQPSHLRKQAILETVTLIEGLAFIMFL